MALPPSHSQAVLPNSQILSLEQIERDENGFILKVRTCQQPCCPNCGELSRSCHSHYHRWLQDLPWQGLSVRIRLKARRFRCRNPGCGRKVFTERLPEVALPHARQTHRLADIVRLIGFVVGGLPGSRLLARLAIETSDDTVLRRVKMRPLTDVIDEPIRSLGVDDWAWRKGQDYGTILVDLEHHRVVDLLPGRSAEELAHWLAQHPTISVISRDRSGLYAEGAQLGAPDATQVADRFHLVLNMSAAIERALEERSSQLQLPAATPSAEEKPQSQGSSPAKPTQQEARQQQRRQRRLERYEQVVQLHREGYSQRAISQSLRIQRKTVRRWLRNGHFPERKRPVRKPSKVHDFADYLQRRWAEGCHNATKLFQEIRGQGYRGQRSMVAKFVSVWRRRGSLSRPNRPQRFAPKQVTILATKSPDRLSDEQRLLLEKLSITCPQLPSMRALALEFREALTSKDNRQMLWWIQNAKQCGIGSMVRFAFGLQKDLAAVLAAVETPWSNGQVEGQVNRLKTLKRQMYGRAGFSLLRARVLPYAPSRPLAVQRAP
jgi:transposase